MYVRASFSCLYEANNHASFSGNNRRVYPREKTQELAELILDLKGRKVACLVHDISDGGVKIESSSNSLPTRFILNYPEKNIRSICRVAWKRDMLFGLEFVKH